MNDLEYRFATQEDVPLLAEMNQSLICDEGHRNKMTLPQLHERMSDWLQGEYTAVIFNEGPEAIGYALYRKDPEWIYLRQLFVKSEMRRKGIGREAISWLKKNAWKETKIIRVEVLVGNPEGISFWKAVGFKDYCITMEMEN
ncbi:MAG: GNAT family N-acetyltransferase [Planctomycetota bacterium]|jgi:GNAT superfamily N-acetyltransferase